MSFLLKSYGILPNKLAIIINNNIELKIPRYRVFIESEKELIRLFLLYIYLVIEAPKRGEEINLIRYSNIIESGPRNLYIDPKPNLITINLNYYKGYSITRVNKNIIKFLL